MYRQVLWISEDHLLIAQPPTSITAQDCKTSKSRYLQKCFEQIFDVGKWLRYISGSAFMFRQIGQIVGANLNHGWTSYQLDHREEKTRQLSLPHANSNVIRSVILGDRKLGWRLNQRMDSGFVYDCVMQNFHRSKSKCVPDQDLDACERWFLRTKII